jgi:hypothetical protein
MSDAAKNIQINDLITYVKEHGASAAARTFEIGYSIVRRRVKAMGVHLCRGRRRDRSLAARNADIRVFRMQGKFLIDIGRLYSLGRERVRQILEETGGDPLKPQIRDVVNTDTTEDPVEDNLFQAVEEKLAGHTELLTPQA